MAQDASKTDDGNHENSPEAVGSSPVTDGGGANRRNFLTRALAVVIGGIVGLFPLVTGLLVFLDPLRSRKSVSGGEGATEGFLRVATVDGLLVGKPRKFTIVDDRVDAWNLFPQEPVGAVYLLRAENDEVRAFNVVCPHAGCFVDFDPNKSIYQCPCHDSSFNVDGSIANQSSPSPRGLDELDVDHNRLQQGEVWVKYQSFRPGTSEKIAEA